MKSTNLLTQEHKLILRALDVLDAMAGLVDSGGKVDEVDVDRLFDFLRWFADAHHQAKEETILFPALKAAATEEDRPIQHMMFEHTQERESVENMEKDLRLGQLSDFTSHAGRFSSTLRNHIYKEDEILFVAADSLLDAERDEAICEQLDHFETPLDKRMLQQKLQDLHSLEWKYLRK
jgi:hemerythrin-like domain-containing protein